VLHQKEVPVHAVAPPARHPEAPCVKEP
jgi:hypothetical protein